MKKFEELLDMIKGTSLRLRFELFNGFFEPTIHVSIENDNYIIFECAHLDPNVLCESIIEILKSPLIEKFKEKTNSFKKEIKPIKEKIENSAFDFIRLQEEMRETTK